MSVETSYLGECGSVEVSLFCCLDPLTLETGRAVIGAIDKCFPAGFWDYAWNVGKASSQKTAISPEVMAAFREELIHKRWPRTKREWDSAVRLMRSNDDTTRISVYADMVGGSTVRQTRMGDVIFQPTQVSLRIDTLGVENGYVQYIRNLLPELALAIQSSYGACGLSSEGWATLDSRLPGIHWATQFGPDLVELIGRDRFADLPVHEIQWLADGGVILYLCESFREYMTMDREARQKEIERLLGRGWFIPDGLMSRHWKSLRNLILEPPPSGPPADLSAESDETPLWEGDPAEKLEELLTETPGAMHSVKESRSFWDDPATDEEMEALYEEYAEIYRRTVERVRARWGEPDFEGDGDEEEFPHWTGAMEVAIWRRGNLWAMVFWDHQDREIPVRVVLRAYTDEEIREMISGDA